MTEEFELKNAFISVYDKDGVFELAEFLIQAGVNILASDGTGKYLRENGINLKTVSEYTGFSPILGGRVKTLHPMIFSGILADSTNPDHLHDLKEYDIPGFQLVIVNLYPFEEKMENVENIDDLTEFIDIGGVALIRAAAKNWKNCLVLTDPSEYEEFMELYKEKDSITEEYLKKKAIRAFSFISYYDAMIAQVFKREFELDEGSFLNISLKKADDLRYGENPHQAASLFQDPVYTGDSIFNYNQIQGKQLSFNNILDIDIAIRIVNDFKEPNSVVIKHNNPCGFAVGNAGLDNFELAWNSDPVSAFGSIIGFNYTVDEEIAQDIFKKFAEVVLCPEITEDAFNILKKKKRLRILVKKNKKLNCIPEPDLRKIKGGTLAQEEDIKIELTDDLELVTEPGFPKEYLNDIFYGLKLIKYFKSNSIILVKHGNLVGAGFGQPNRVDCVKMAIEKAGDKIKDSVLVSDAFFPFRDSIDLVKDGGLAGIVQPGGSIRDKEVIQACNEFEIPMYFTGIRHFKH